MKAKLTISIEKALALQACQVAESRGISLSAFIEEALFNICKSADPFSAKWKGRVKLARRTGLRFQRLKKKYL